VGGRQSTSAGVKPLPQRIAELGLRDRVILTGVVPPEDVPTLMSAARVFAYVSYYEGFGLSPLEAMACGTPVVTSNTSSLPEVVGDAGILADPNDESAIAAGILALLDDSALRERLREQSVARARQFSWRRTVQGTFDLYRAVASC
jgi:glycosyltransferase involved in cell wall biosynthesis